MQRHWKQNNACPRPTNRGAGSAGRQGYWFFIHYLGSQDATFASGDPQDAELTEEGKKRRLEAVLFLSPEGITSRKMAKLAGLADATEARTLIRQLNQEYDQQGRSFRVEEVAGGFALLTRSHFAPWLRRLAYIPGEMRLSQSAMETLAIVAYRQPVLRANVEAIRGVGCSEVLKQLMELDLVRISGRSDDLGRPYLYGTTRRFLQMFGLRSADRLPRIDWVNGESQGETIEQAHLSLSSQELADTDSETKESTVNKSFSATALLEENAKSVDDTLLEGQLLVPSAIDDDDDDDFYDDDEEDDDDFDDDDEKEDFDDEDEWDDDEEDEDGEEDDLDEEDGQWEEVDDEDDDWEEEDDDDWGDDEDEDWD